jgi:hypothetical protein
MDGVVSTAIPADQERDKIPDLTTKICTTRGKQATPPHQEIAGTKTDVAEIKSTTGTAMIMALARIRLAGGGVAARRARVEKLEDRATPSCSRDCPIASLLMRLVAFPTSAEHFDRTDYRHGIHSATP